MMFRIFSLVAIALAAASMQVKARACELPGASVAQATASVAGEQL